VAKDTVSVEAVYAVAGLFRVFCVYRHVVISLYSGGRPPRFLVGAVYAVAGLFHVCCVYRHVVISETPASTLSNTLATLQDTHYPGTIGCTS
jgi:hypothetical protein